MKYIIALLLMCFTSQLALADCNWATGITPGPNKTFIYSEACHLKVGELNQSNKTKDVQIKDLLTAIDLKNLAIKWSDDRTILWQKSALDEQERLTKMESSQSTSGWLFFGLGALTVIGAGYMASSLIHH
jgi:hypothetical protein